jgi:heavy metal sensor kinase
VPRVELTERDIEISAPLVHRFGDGEEGTAYYVIYRPDGGVLKTSRPGTDVPDPGPLPPATAPAAGGMAAFAAFVAPAPEPPKVRQRGDLREAYVHGPFGMRWLVGRSIARERAELRRLAWLLAGIGAGVLVVGLGGGWFLSARVVRPIRTITAAAKEISASNLSRRIDAADTRSELGSLAAVLNDTFARLEAAFQQQVRFTADASHELRTPLAVIHTHAQLALTRDRPAEDYRRTIETCLRASKRMKGLVDSLLLLARADAGRLTLDRQPFDLSDVVGECAALVATLAAEKAVTVETDLAAVELTADPGRVGQVATNLLTNAIRYNKEGGSVRVTVAADGADAVLTVADTGIGIPAESQAHVFERFYRADESRTREPGGPPGNGAGANGAAAGGSGLGLAICKSVVEAHGGSITFRSEPGAGTTFTVRLPRDCRVEPNGKADDPHTTQATACQPA